MVLVGTYTNIDGFFIGNVTGDNGLAAINIVWPIVAFITSLGTGLGIGGSVILNKMRGTGDERAAEQVKATMLFLLVAVGVLAGAILKLTYEPLLKLMGAEGQVLVYSIDYADIVCIGALFQILGSGLVALLRNEQKTYFSMVCCIVGLIVHLLLDMLLVNEYKLKGVAISTVISQAVIMLFCLFALRAKKPLDKESDQSGKWWQKPLKNINREYLLPILGASTSPFGINFVPSIVLLFTNYFALEVGGTAAVSAYAVMSYAVYTFDYIYQGVCDGVQPILSYCCGAKDKEGENRALRSSAIILGAFTIAFILLTPALIAVMPKLFAVSDTAQKMMTSGFILYAIAYPFKAAVKFVCSYYYAVGKTKPSNLLIYADPLIFTPLFLIALPMLWAMDGIWLSMTFAQICVAALGGFSLLRTFQKNKE
jgi:Na+-driven multidrug efflux pump